MNLQAQIELITVPQDFVRLCNAILQAEHGTDFLPIDDDRPDRGNDGYLKSQKRIYAAHCFKRVQNQSIDRDIRTKMLGDLRKAVVLKAEGHWDIRAWTFLSNYPLAEAIAADVVVAGKKEGIDVSWYGPAYFANSLQRLKSVRDQFPGLYTNQISDQLDTIWTKLESLTEKPAVAPVTWMPSTADEQRALVDGKPPGWEHLLFGGVLFQGKERLEPKWRDYKAGYAPPVGSYLDRQGAIQYLSRSWDYALSIAEGIMVPFDEDAQLAAFGAPGEHGNAHLIEHFAGRIVASYEELLNWAAGLRGAAPPDRFRKAFECAALVAEQPAQDIRNFIDDAAAAIQKIPSHLAKGGSVPLEIRLILELTANDQAIRTFGRALKKAK